MAGKLKALDVEHEAGLGRHFDGYGLRSRLDERDREKLAVSLPVHRTATLARPAVLIQAFAQHVSSKESMKSLYRGN